MKIDELTQQEIIELVLYNRPTGKAFWNYRDIKWFANSERQSAEGACNIWNAQHAGKEITTKDTRGYYRPSLFNKNVLLHRLIWFRETGEWPNIIDHINGIITDNRWENLRNVTQQENHKNRKLSKNNNSGVIGITRYKPTGKWLARIQFQGRPIHLGYFDLLEEAIAARKTAEIEYGYHEGHGKI